MSRHRCVCCGDPRPKTWRRIGWVFERLIGWICFYCLKELVQGK